MTIDLITKVLDQARAEKLVSLAVVPRLRELLESELGATKIDKRYEDAISDAVDVAEAFAAEKGVPFTAVLGEILERGMRALVQAIGGPAHVSVKGGPGATITTLFPRKGAILPSPKSPIAGAPLPDDDLPDAS